MHIMHVRLLLQCLIYTANCARTFLISILLQVAGRTGPVGVIHYICVVLAYLIGQYGWLVDAIVRLQGSLLDSLLYQLHNLTF